MISANDQPPDAHAAEDGQKDPSMPQVDWGRCDELVALGESGDMEGAVSGLREVAAGPGSPRERAAVQLMIASFLRRLGKPHLAREALAEAKGLVGTGTATDARATYMEAWLDLDQGGWEAGLRKLDAVLRDSRQALEEPGNSDLAEHVSRNRGIALCRLGRYVEALPLLERAAALDEEKPWVLYHLGRCCYRLGKLVEAGEHLLAALAFDNLSPGLRADAHYTLGLSYRWRGQAARALEQFRWCLENDKKPTISRRSVLTGIVDAYKALGQDDEAARYSEMLRKA